MASRSERREMARMEAGIKLAVFGVVALAFMIGGVSGFASALGALIFFLVVLAIAGVAGVLILKSRLMPGKKLGLLLIISSALTVWLWSGAHAPRQWPEERATVISISGPSAVTETEYSFQPGLAANGSFLLAVEKKPWAKLSEAKNYRAGPAIVYFNPANPSEVRFESVNGWVRTTADAVSTRVRVTGEGTATLRVGSVLFPKMATTTGPQVANYTVGAAFPVWINPVSQTELSRIHAIEVRF